MVTGAHLMLCVVVGSTLVAGCAAWKKEPVEKRRELPIARMSPDSVGLDYGFIRVPMDQVSAVNAMWRELDETRISPDRRQLLLRNGMRCAIVGEQLPDSIRQLLDHPTSADDPYAEIAFEVDSDGRKERASEKTFRHLNSRSGQPNHIVASDVLPQLDVITHRQGLLAGRTFRDAQCIFLLKSFPLGDGRVRLELTPEIHHGAPQRDMVADMGIWRFDMSRKREVYESLRVEAMLSPGESLLVASAPNDRGLGKNFLVPHVEKTSWKRKMLIVRLAQTQHDALFSAEADALPPAPRVRSK